MNSLIYNFYNFQIEIGDNILIYLKYIEGLFLIFPTVENKIIGIKEELYIFLSHREGYKLLERTL